jgi:hypothetical protein
MEYSEYVMLNDNKLGQDFLAAREELLSQGILLFNSIINRRFKVYQKNVDEIESERREKEHRLMFLASDVGSEKVALMNHVAKLGSEARSERRAVVSDIARMSKDLFEKLTEYSELKSLTEGSVPRAARPVVIKSKGGELEWI